MRGPHSTRTKHEGPTDYSLPLGAAKIPLSIAKSRLNRLREKFSIPDAMELLVPRPDKRACFPKHDCFAISEAILYAERRTPFELL